MLDAKLFMEALDELEAQKGISKEAIISALKEALRKAYAKSLGGGDDADIRVEITQDLAAINMAYVRKVVDEVQDDYLEVSVEDAQKINKKLKAGDELVQEVSLEEMKRLTALTVKSVLRQKISEAEKLALYESHKDKVGEMITAIVEKCDDRGAIVNIGRTSVYLSRRELIGDEMFDAGDPIRIYVADVTTTEKGPMIKVSRSDPGYLRRVFEEEIREIYDGTVIIKALARDAGIRAKVAVYSNDPNVDCVGACIGPGGSTIQKIVAQLGDSKDKEKIDIISYSPNPGLFIVDAIRPASVSFINLNPEEKKATVIVPDGQLSLAIGRKGANARVACRLTGWNIDIKEEHEKDSLGLEFQSIEQLQEQEKERLAKEKYTKYLEQIKAQRAAEEVRLESGVEKSKPQQITDEDVSTSAPVETKVEEPVKEEPVPEVVVEIKPKAVKTTTTLESLEQSLENEKKKSGFKGTQKTSRRPRNITEEEVAHEQPKEEKAEVKKPQMEIYTKEELEELEKETNDTDVNSIDEEDIDYDDFDKYYDDDDK